MDKDKIIKDMETIGLKFNSNDLDGMKNRKFSEFNSPIDLCKEIMGKLRASNNELDKLYTDIEKMEKMDKNKAQKAYKASVQSNWKWDDI